MADVAPVVGAVWVDQTPHWASAGIPPAARPTTRRIVKIGDIIGEHVHGYAFWQHLVDGEWQGVAGGRGYATRFTRRSFTTRFRPEHDAELPSEVFEADIRARTARDIRLFGMTVDLSELGPDGIIEMAALVAERRVDPAGVASP